MLRLIAILKIALRALQRNRMRSTLTALGIIIGVGAVIAMVAIGNGARATVEAQIQGLGQNLIRVRPGSSNVGGVRGGGGSGNSLTVDDAYAIRSELSAASAVSPEFQRGRTISAGNQNWNTQVQGQGEDYFYIREWTIAEGTFFADSDVERASKVAVVGQTVAEQLFPGEDAIGKTIRVRNTPFVVIGVLGRKGADVSGRDQDDVMIIPITAMKFVQGSVWINNINVQAASPDLIDPLKQEIIALLRQRHRIEADREDDFTVQTQEELTDALTQTQRTMTWLLAGIAFVSLVVGGIGIMNIMLVSVTERTREIGTRIAVGARARDIMLQFLVEAVMLSAIGGFLGIVIGAAASVVLVCLLQLPAGDFFGSLNQLLTGLKSGAVPVGVGFDAAGLQVKVGNSMVLVSNTAIVVAAGFSAVVGIFFGFYPARKAARLDPIEALRFE